MINYSIIVRILTIRLILAPVCTQLFKDFGIKGHMNKNQNDKWASIIVSGFELISKHIPLLQISISIFLILEKKLFNGRQYTVILKSQRDLKN